jgi:hypothetical protein
MTLFPYNLNIPAGPDNPSADRPLMTENTNSISGIIAVDHVGFDLNNGGYHTVIHSIPFSTTGTNPPKNQPVVSPAATAGFGQIFTAQINDGINPDEALYFESGGGRVTQFTRNFTPTNAANGSTFLPGGLILNWGQIPASSSSTYPALFIQPFTVLPYSIVITGQRAGSDPGSSNAWVINSSVTTNGFQIFNDGAHNFGWNWIAIGN